MLKNLTEKIALRFGDRSFTYSQLFSNINKFSSQYSLDEGEHAVIFAENCPEWIFAFYSIWQKKAIAIPVDNLATEQETAYILNDCQPRVIFTSIEKKEVIINAIALSGIKATVILLDEITKGKDETTFEQVKFPAPIDDKTAVIIYTSGTTGSPKGVMLTYKNLITNIRAVSEHIPIYKSDSMVMMLLPAHHIFPLVGTMIIPLYVGATIAISPSMASSDIMNTLQVNGVTIVIGVPRLYAAIRKGIMDKVNKSFIARTLFAMARKINKPSFSKKVFGTVHKKLGGSIQHLVSGGAALAPEIGADYQTLGFEVLEGYGMTEAAPMITFTQPGRVKIGSPGELMKETTIKIVDGEILASGPNIMKGYYKKNQETDLVLRDGWLYTGDLGYIDEEGFLFITGRKKEIIILSNGKNVNPVELEDQLLQSPYIKDCGVFYDNDQIKLLIKADESILNDPQSRTSEEVIKWEVIEPFNKSVSSYKKIRGFFITNEELPRTRLGKLQRYKLQPLAIATSLDQPTTEEHPESPEYGMLVRFLEEEKSRKVFPHHHLEMDLGMDSLDKVSLQAWLIQTFGVTIDANEMTAFGSVSKLAEYVSMKKTRMEDSKVDWKDIVKEKINLKLPSTWFTGRYMVYASRIFFNLYFRFKSKGTNNIPEGPVIFVPNHQSFFDGLFIASFLRKHQMRNTYFYAKEKHFKQSWLKFLANRNNIIIVDINKDLKESIQKMAEVLRQKRNLIIFPEGTRTKTGGLGQFKKTFAILSRELNVPVIPVSIKGAYEALPAGSFFPRPWKKIQIEFLKPVYPENHSYDSLTMHVRDQIQTILSNEKQ